jgi:hypothetical protein
VFLGAGNNGQVPTIEAMEAWYNQAIHPGSNEVHFTVYDLDDLAPIGTARAYTSAGFREIGRRRGASVTIGQRHDQVLMDAVADEFSGSVLAERAPKQAPTLDQPGG